MADDAGRRRLASTIGARITQALYDRLPQIEAALDGELIPGPRGVGALEGVPDFQVTVKFRQEKEGLEAHVSVAGAKFTSEALKTELRLKYDNGQLALFDDSPPSSAPPSDSPGPPQEETAEGGDPRTPPDGFLTGDEQRH